MYFDIQVTDCKTGERATARVEGSSPESALARARRRGFTPVPGTAPILVPSPTLTPRPDPVPSARKNATSRRTSHSHEMHQPEVNWNRPARRLTPAVTLVVAIATVSAASMLAAAWWPRSNAAEPAHKQPSPAPPLEIVAGSSNADDLSTPPPQPADRAPNPPPPLQVPPLAEITPSSGSGIEIIAGPAGETPTPLVAAGEASHPTPAQTSSQNSVPAPADQAGSVVSLADRERLYQALSAPFVRSGTLQHRKPDPAILAELSTSADPHVASLSQVQLALEGLVAAETADDDVENAQRQIEWNSLVVDFLAGTVEDVIFEKDNSFEIARDAVNSDFIASELDRLTRAHVLSMRAEEVLADMRIRIRQEFVPLQPSTAEVVALDGIAVTGTLHEGYGMAFLRNGTRQTLHRCVITADMLVDSAKYAKYIARKAAHDAPAVGILSIIGVNVEGSVALETAKVQYLATTRGSMAYIDTWPPGVTIAIPIAEPQIMDLVGGKVEMWIGCDEGIHAQSLDAAELARQMRPPPPVTKQRAPSKRPGNRRDPGRR
jgi:hypothetical protein